MNQRRSFLEELGDSVIVGDGAIGTELFARGAAPECGVERLNLLSPEMVLNLHRDYVAAGSRVIETNTFGANRPNLAALSAERELREILLAGVKLARSAGDVYVAGSVGPLPSVEGEPLGESDQIACFTEQVQALVEGGVDLLIFESFTNSEEIARAIRVGRAISDLPIVAQMAFGLEGCASDGTPANVAASLCLSAGADVVGANCGYGISSIATAVKKMAPLGAPMSAYMNAGFPEQVEGRLVYLSTPEYLAHRAQDLVKLGVRLIGGCCGTGPETIRAIARAVAEVGKIASRPTVVMPRRPETPPEIAVPPAPTLGRIMVELDPPTSPDLAPVLAAARELKKAGVESVTVADNPLASVRVDNIAVAALIQRETGLSATPHLTGRDRNRIALQSAVMGAHVQGIRSLLCITGDPVRMCEEPNTSGVFDLTSVGLVRLVSEYNSGRRTDGAYRTAFSIGVAVNPNVRSLAGQIGKLARKIEAGARFMLTQPVFTEERLDELQEALADAGIDIPVYLGIMPITSLRNAEFLHNEVPGIFIPEEFRRELEKHEAVTDQRAAALDMMRELVVRVAPKVHGLYMMAPRNKVEYVLPLLASAKALTGRKGGAIVEAL
ncbi:MAG: bifunctional homocysteine S-methyltransferase/methylenetetrahydrofolate reductase [Armatimonadota bacterium]